MLPGTSSEMPTDGADIALPTGLGVTRNVLVVRVAQVVVAIGGGAGTPAKWPWPGNSTFPLLL